MKKILLSIIAVVYCMTASADPQNVNGVYQLGSKEDLVWFANYVNSGNTTACAILTADITMNANVLDSDGRLNSDNTFTAWTPIGGHTVDYAGEFNGNGHTISGLYFNDPSKNNVGLFGKVGNNAYIHDVGIKDSYFYGKDHVGGICGDFASGRIENCWNGATVIANSKDKNNSCAGGITASCWTAASIRGCYNIGKISVESSDKSQCGGICGTVAKNTGVACSVSYCVSLEGKCDSHKAYNLYNFDAVVENVVTRNSDAFESGEVCYLLNSGVTNGSQKWYQTLGTDDYPVLDNSRGVAYHGYDGDELKYSNTELTAITPVHHEVCDATCNAVGYTRECWEDTKSGKIFAEATCATELNPAYAVTYPSVTIVPDCYVTDSRWNYKVEQTYDGVDFEYAEEKNITNSGYYQQSEYVIFTMQEAASKTRLKWALIGDKRELSGTFYYTINDGEAKKMTTLGSYSPNVESYSLPDLKEGDVVKFHTDGFHTWNYPLMWAVTLEYITGHDVQHVDAKAATCTEKGNYENWYCKKCDKHFANAECTTVMTDWEIPALGHNATHHEPKAATCTEDGNIDHWHCSNCNLNYREQTCTNQITDDVVLPKLNHKNKEHQARVEATCLTDGNIEYWHCPDCSTYFTNEACTASTTDYIIAALGHDFTYTPYRTSTCTSEGDVEHWHCNRCEKDFNTGEEMASEDHVISGSLIIPCKESDAIVVGMDEGKVYDDCHTFTPPTEEGETTIATVTLGEGVISMKIKNGEETAYSLNETKPLETFFAHTFKLTANQDPDNANVYYSTFYTSEGAYKVPNSTMAYIGSVVDKDGETDVLKLSNVGGVIPQGEAVILKATDSSIELLPSARRLDASSENDLEGTDKEKTLGVNEYALSYGQNGVGFYLWNGKSIGANKAYLILPSSAKAFTFEFEDVPTGISSTEQPYNRTTETYNLNGMMVGKNYKGIVIKNGKKYLKK